MSASAQPIVYDLSIGSQPSWWRATHLAPARLWESCGMAAPKHAYMQGVYGVLSLV